MNDEDRLLRMLNANEKLNASIKYFIELFVEYYGEEEREYIENKFKRTFFVGYQNDSQLEATLREIEKNKSKKLIKNILADLKFDLTEKDLFDRIDDFEYASSTPINKLNEFMEEYSLGEEKRNESYYEKCYNLLKEFIPSLTYDEYQGMVQTGRVSARMEALNDETKEHILSYTNISWYQNFYARKKNDVLPLLQKINPDITLENLEDKIKNMPELLVLLEKYNKAINEFNEYKKKFSKYYALRDENKNKFSNTSSLHYREYLKKIKELVPEKVRVQIDDYLNNKNGRFSWDIGAIIGQSLDGQSIYEYFSEDANEKLLNSSEGEIQRIKENRIKYFNAIGINYGTDYEEYLKHPEIWPSKEVVEKVLYEKEIEKSKYLREYYLSVSPFKDIIFEEEKREFMDRDVESIISCFAKGTTCVIPNISKNGDEYKEEAMVMINFDGYRNVSQDHLIIHELNHLYELSLQSASKDEYVMTCGWDIINGNLNGTVNNEESIEFERDKRKYELFNEIINERIAKEISEIMTKRGLSIFESGSEKNYNNSTGYDSTNYLINDFFETYKKEILASRKNNNMQIILDMVGEENFNELNSLFEIHNNNFGGMKIYSLYSDLNEKKDTEMTRIYYGLISKRDKILENMANHYMAYNMNNDKHVR